jgi:hypothetical protein
MSIRDRFWQVSTRIPRTGRLIWGLWSGGRASRLTGPITFTAKGAQGVVTLEPSGQVYVDNKNEVMRASSVSVEIDEQGACG